jgi:hypothetical protein
VAPLCRRGTDLKKARVTCQNVWRGPHRKHRFLYCCESMFTAPLPSSRSIRCLGNAFTKPLTDNVYTRYNIINHICGLPAISLIFITFFSCLALITVALLFILFCKVVRDSRIQTKGTMYSTLLTYICRRYCITGQNHRFAEKKTIINLSQATKEMGLNSQSAKKKTKYVEVTKRPSD